MSVCCEHIAIIEQLAKSQVAASGKPSYSFGRDGNHPAETHLDANGKPSNKVGIPFGLNNGLLIDAWVGKELLVAYDLEIYYHLGDEVGITTLTTVSLLAGARTKIFTPADFGIVAVPKNVQIGCKIASVVSTNPRRNGVHLTILGSA